MNNTSERTYPIFGPEDDDFHPLSERWWETETCWFSWYVPERKMGGWTYCLVRPNAHLCNGGAWVWDDTGAYPWELRYHASYEGLDLPEQRDLRDFQFPNGVHVKCLEPLRRYRVDYVDEGELEVHIEFDAIMPPNPHPTGVPPFVKGVHFDQAGHVTGHMVLDGETIAIDCYALRDRSWGPRPKGRPRKRRTSANDVQTGTGGVGYSYATASPKNGFLVYSVPERAADPITCGYLIRDGEYAHVLSGSRRVELDPKSGWVSRIVVEATDDLGRTFVATGEALSRHWKGHGGDTLMRWSWDDVVGFGEDQSYFSKATWRALRTRAPAVQTARAIAEPDGADRSGPLGLPAAIERWAEQVTGGSLIRADRRPGGGRREAWFVDLRRPDGAVDELFLRLDRRPRSGRGDPYDTVREAEIYRALAAAGMLVPRVVAVHESPQAVLSERVAGETWFARIRDPAEQLAVARDFIRWLATLHRIPGRSLQLPSFSPVADLPTHVGQELDAWEAIYRADPDVTDPLIEFALDWLRRNVPPVREPVVLVQGDTGPGNFLYAGSRVTAILDWELAHWGDPMEDLAWLSVRATQEPFTHLPDRLVEYATLSGFAIDAPRIRYHRVFAELRIVIMGHGRKHATIGEVGNNLIYAALHHRLLVESLADVTGIALEPFPLPTAPEPEHAWLYDAALAEIRDVIVPRSADPFVVLRAKGLARIVKHLRDCDRLAASYDAEDLDDLADLLGARPSSAGAGREALARRGRERTIAPERLLRYFHRWTTRRTSLAASASGALAERHFPPIT